MISRTGTIRKADVSFAAKLRLFKFINYYRMNVNLIKPDDVKIKCGITLILQKIFAGTMKLQIY